MRKIGICLAKFERDDYTTIYDHKIRSVCNAESLPWTWRYIMTRFNRKHILCGRSLPCRQSKKMSRLIMLEN